MGNSPGFIILGTTISQDNGDLGLSQIQSVFFSPAMECKLGNHIGNKAKCQFLLLHHLPPPPWLFTDQEAEAKRGKAACSRARAWQVAEPGFEHRQLGFTVERCLFIH